MNAQEMKGDAGAKERKSAAHHHVCPWWLGYILCCPLRRFLEKPEKILASYVRSGMTVLEPGCGMGYFSLPLARLVGPGGRVLCVDLQPPMIKRLLKRVQKAGLADRVEALVCTAGDMGLERWRGKVDLVTAFYVIHEVPDGEAFLAQVHDLLRPSGRLLVLEPKGHVSAEEFTEMLARARKVGFTELEPPGPRRGHAALLEKH